jgi:DNA-binding response OmpR family regulator
MVQAIKSVKPATLPCVLVVDDEPAIVELIGYALGIEKSCRVLTASSIRQAKRILSTRTVELLITDLNLPDGDGATLVESLHRHQPLASAIVITGAPTVDTTIRVLREGAIDLLSKPFTIEGLQERVGKALRRQGLLARNEARIDRLRDAVKRLNEARRQVTRKVDLLCNDLVSAYTDLSKQLEAVRTTESFRAVCTAAVDLEQLLCHAMDWVLRQVGFSNLAVWLASDDEFQLGAYMKYSVTGDPELTEAMRTGLVARINRDGFLRLEGAPLRQQLTATEKPYLSEQTVIGISCNYLGETLATIVLFRDHTKPFTDEHAALLKEICPVFAVALATIVRQVQKFESDETPFHDGDIDSHGPGSRDDSADWWKRGEQPPF